MKLLTVTWNIDWIFLFNIPKITRAILYCNNCTILVCNIFEVNSVCSSLQGQQPKYFILRILMWWMRSEPTLSWQIVFYILYKLWKILFLYFNKFNLNIYAVQQDTQSFFNDWVYSSHMLARHISDLTGPSSGAFYKLYLHWYMVLLCLLPHTKYANTACKTLLKMDRWGPKYVQLTYVMNKLNH